MTEFIQIKLQLDLVLFCSVKISESICGAGLTPHRVVQMNVSFLDVVVAQFHEWFTNHSNLAWSLCSLVPGYFSCTTLQGLMPALNMYKHFVLHHTTDAKDYEVEYKLWKGKWNILEKDLLPLSICGTLAKYSENYPVTKILLQIHASLLVSSASAKSFSTLNHVKRKRRATMGQDWLMKCTAKLNVHRSM